MTDEEKKAHPDYDLYVKYQEACAQRDAIYATVQSDEDALTEVNAQIASLQSRQAEISQRIDKHLDASFLQLKKRIATLARALSAANGLLAT